MNPPLHAILAFMHRCDIGIYALKLWKKSNCDIVFVLCWTLKIQGLEVICDEENIKKKNV